jgi:hypothetical protein
VALVDITGGIQLGAEIPDKLAGLISQEVADESGQIRDRSFPDAPGLRVQDEPRRIDGG